MMCELSLSKSTAEWCGSAVVAFLSEDEQDSQATYEDFTAQTSATIKAKQSEVDGKMKEIPVGDVWVDLLSFTKLSVEVQNI